MKPRKQAGNRLSDRGNAECWHLNTPFRPRRVLPSQAGRVAGWQEAGAVLADMPHHIYLSGLTWALTCGYKLQWKSEWEDKLRTTEEWL